MIQLVHLLFFPFLLLIFGINSADETDFDKKNGNFWTNLYENDQLGNGEEVEEFVYGISDQELLIESIILSPPPVIHPKHQRVKFSIH